MVRYENIDSRNVKVGDTCEVKGRNPFDDDETWRVEEIREGNDAISWYKLTQVEDIRNILVINYFDFQKQFVKRIETK